VSAIEQILVAAVRMLGEGAVKAAIEYSRVATVAAPDDWRPYAVRARALARLDRSAEAVATLEMARRGAPFQATISAEIGHALGRLGSPARAVNPLRVSLILEPERSPESAAVAAALLSAGAQIDGTRWTARALTLAPDQTTLLGNLFNSWTNGGRDLAASLPVAVARQIARRIRDELDRGRAPRGRRLYYLHAQSDRLGHLAHELYMLRAVYLHRCDDIVVLVRDRVANPAVLDMFARGMTVERSPTDGVLAFGATPMPGEALEPLGLVTRPNLFSRFIEEMSAGAPRRHVDLNASDLDRGRRMLQRLGVAEDADIVTLHVREPSLFPGKRHHRHRDADLTTYLPAIKSLTAAGRTVVRLGDATMTRLPDLGPNVIDLPFHPAYEPFCDPYLIAVSRYFIGTFSGPLSIALALGTPALLLNCMIEYDHDLRLNPQDRLVPKHYLDESTGRLLTRDEILARKLDRAVTADALQQRGVALIALSADEISQAIGAMDRDVARTAGPGDMPA
jgi:putative glycosyltransferase (TIGR04372 family)